VFCVVLFFVLFCVVCCVGCGVVFLLATFGALVAPPSDFWGVFVFGGYVIWPILLNDGGYFPLLMITPPRCICGVNPLFSGTEIRKP
jgi:ABC-type polysaccharide/polyol phosphate export permease